MKDMKVSCQVILRGNAFFGLQMKVSLLKQWNKTLSVAGNAPKEICMGKTWLPTIFSPAKDRVSSDGPVSPNRSTVFSNIMHSNVSKFCFKNNITGTANIYGVSSHHRFNLLVPASCYVPRVRHVAKYSTSNEKAKELGTGVTQSSSIENLKIALKEYGPVITVLYLSTSFISLFSCYFIIRSGACQWDIFKDWGIDEGATTAGVAATLMVAYAVHKSLAPLRMGLTLVVSPFLVKKLRNWGYLKSTKPKQV